MGMAVTTGATIMCSFGIAPSALNATPKPMVVNGLPVATVTDNVPVANIPPFGMSTSLANPTVAAATAAALGVLTPMPCVPVTPAPWLPGAPTVLVGAVPALSFQSKCMCVWGGVITILQPGQTVLQVP